jgi:small subunit ribosomal protein S17
MSDQTAVSRKNEKVGQVVSTKMAKTIVVEVTRRVQHPLYKRVVTRRKRFYAHDEEGTARMGDTVRIIESRPLSRLKKWRLGEVLRRAAQVSVEPENVEDLAPAPVAEMGTR